MNQVRAWARLSLFVGSLSGGILLCVISSLFGGNRLRRNMKIRRGWVVLISRLIGLRMTVTGEAPGGAPYLYVSNHRSFMDPVVALHYLWALPLAKAEVSGYPLIGYGARITGVLFVKRESLRSRLSARQAIHRTLDEGHNVLIYPEGTTNDQSNSMAFKPGSFEVAASMGVSVIPMAMEYLDPNDHWKDRSLLGQYLYQFGKRRSHCHISFGPAVQSDDAVLLRTQAQTWIDNQLQRARQAYDRSHH